MTNLHAQRKQRPVEYMKFFHRRIVWPRSIGTLFFDGESQLMT
jgi:hypothetical protein